MLNHVLIVEDDPAIRGLLCRQLEKSGYDPAAVERGEDALRIAAVRPPDVILLDVALPGIDGWETLSRLQSNARTARIPVVMLTGSGMPDDIIRGYRAGAAYYVPKPYSLDELLRGLRIVESGLSSGQPPSR